MKRLLILAFMALFAVSASAQTVHKTDVLIIGSGGTGMAAAVSASESGVKSVTVIEKMFAIGGNTILSGGVINAIDEKRQAPLGIKDNAELFTQDIIGAGDGLPNKDLVYAMTSHSQETLYWLEAMGLKVNDEIFSKGEGNSVIRSHNTAPSASGKDYIAVLKAAADKNKVTITTNMKATQLIKDKNGVVNQVKAVDSKGNEHLYEAKAVILATGGFGGNVEMRMKFDPRLTAAFGTTNNPGGKGLVGNTGDGIVMAEKIGAGVTGMEYIQLLALSGGNVVDYVGAEVFVTTEGKRFVDETGRRDVISNATLDAPGGWCWTITDSQSTKNRNFEAKLKDGTVMQANSVAEMAQKMGVDPKVLEATMKRFNENAAKGQDPDFGRKVFAHKTIDKAPFYFGKQSQEVHYTMGGVTITPKTEVTDTKGKVIKGLYAAGEVTGGMHGSNRVGGNAVLEIMVMGRIAGQEAAKSVK